MKKKILNKHFILHLSLIEDIGPSIIQKILQGSDISVSDLYSFSQTDWINVFGFTEITAQKLVDGLANTKILEEELALIEQNNIQWMTFEEEDYPQLLKQIYLPPAALYIQGSLSVVHGIKFSSARPELVEGYLGALEDILQQVQNERTRENTIDKQRDHDSSKLLAIVGARKADQYGYQVINQLIPELVAAQYTIVSGGALGIDAAAHEVTLKHGGKTIAVLGSGLLQPYPMSNKKLFASIIESGGCMVSSFPLRMLPMSGHFPARNRIITGLSHGCLVVQAAQKSGALISAHYAVEQGREVFAIPGPIGSELSVGCNVLIQQGAKLVTCSNDILEEFGDRMIIDKKVIEEKAKQLSLEAAVIPAKKIEQIVGKYNNYSALSAEALAKEEAKKLIIFACKQSISFDAIVNATQLTHELIQTELFNLQFDGVIEQDFTGMWRVLQE